MHERRSCTWNLGRTRHSINFRPSPDHIPTSTTRIGILLRQHFLFHPLRSPLMAKGRGDPGLERFAVSLQAYPSPQKWGGLGLQHETTKACAGKVGLPRHINCGFAPYWYCDVALSALVTACRETQVTGRAQFEDPKTSKHLNTQIPPLNELKNRSAIDKSLYF